MNGSPKIRPEAERVAMDVLEGDTTNGRLHRALIAFCEAEGLTVETREPPVGTSVKVMEQQRLMGPWREVEDA